MIALSFYKEGDDDDNNNNYPSSLAYAATTDGTKSSTNFVYCCSTYSKMY
ncbi:MAG TPA: hypothetical protein VI278_00765 [Nitrososphaeraceae archaeon]